MLYVTRKGFSLIELLVVMGMMSILLSIGGLSLGNIRNDTQLDLISSEIKSELLKVQIENTNGKDVGIFFDTNRYVYFVGNTYTEGAPTNEENKLPSNLTFSERTFLDNVARFDKVTGYLATYVFPSRVVLSQAIGGETRTISVNDWGVIEID